MTHAAKTEQTTIVYYRVPTGDGGLRHYQGVFLRSTYHGARPGDDLVRQVSHVGYVCHVEPGARVEPVCEMREPRATQEEVEEEARRFVATLHRRAARDVEETARHVFEPARREVRTR